MKTLIFNMEKTNSVKYKFHNSEPKMTLKEKTNGLKTFSKATFRFATFKLLLFK